VAMFRLETVNVVNMYVFDSSAKRQCTLLMSVLK